MARYLFGLSILLMMLHNAPAIAQGLPFYDVTAFGAKCMGPDGHVQDTNAFQNAITQAKTTGGTIEVPPTTGGACVIDSTLDFSNTGGVCLVGGIGAGGVPGGGAGRPTLVFTQSTGPGVKFGSSIGFCMKDLILSENNSAFTGVFIDGHTSATWGTGFATFQNLNIGAQGTPSCIISFDSTYNSIIDTVWIGGGQAQVCGTGGGYNDTVRNSAFGQGSGTSVEILNPTDGWMIGPDNDFELFQSGGAPVAVQIQSGVSCHGINLIGNWAGDNFKNTNAYNLIDIPSTSCSITVRGNFLSGNPSNTTAIRMAGGKLVADGNTFDAVAAPFSLGSSVVADIGVNTYWNGVSQSPMSSMGGGGRYTDSSQMIFYGDGAGGAPALQVNGNGLRVNGSVSTAGNVTVNGSVSKAAGGFRIDHPLDPAHKYLLHSFVESPDMKNLYEGTVTLDHRGEAEVRLPDYFEALNRDFRYQLSPIGRFAPVFISQEVKGNLFRIAGGELGLKVSWLVTGIRQDTYANAHRIQVEEPKPGSKRTHSFHAAAKPKRDRTSCSLQARATATVGSISAPAQSCTGSEREVDKGRL